MRNRNSLDDVHNKSSYSKITNDLNNGAVVPPYYIHLYSQQKATA